MMKKVITNDKQHALFCWIIIFTVLGFLSIFVSYLWSVRPAYIIIGTLWGLSLVTILLSVRYQLYILWFILPLMDMFKRMVFVDPSATDFLSYLVLFTPDLLIISILLKYFIASLYKSQRLHLARLDIAFLFFGVYSAISALILSDISLLTRLAAFGMRVWPMVAFLLYAKKINRPKDLYIIAKLSLVISLIVAVYGLRQFFFGPLHFEQAWSTGAVYSTNIRHLEYDYKQGVFRTYSTLDSHSSYGVFLSLGLVSIWILRDKLRCFLTIISSFILLAGLIVSFTRFTWSIPFWIAGFLLLFSVARIKPLIDLRKYRKAFLILLMIVGAYFVLYSAMNYLYGQRLVSSTNPYLKRAFGTGTLEARLQGGNVLSSGELSLFGNGLANAGFFARKFGAETTDVNYHNMFIDMIGDLGIVGFTIFLWFLYELFRRGVSVIRANQQYKTRSTLVALFSLLLAWLLVGHFNGAVFYFGHAIPFYFWALCGIIGHYPYIRWSKYNPSCP